MHLRVILRYGFDVVIPSNFSPGDPSQFELFGALSLGAEVLRDLDATQVVAKVLPASFSVSIARQLHGINLRAQERDLARLTHSVADFVEDFVPIGAVLAQNERRGVLTPHDVRFAA